MAANIWDNSDADNDGNNLNNWSLGNVPTGTDVMTFDSATTSANCTFSGNISCQGMAFANTYTGTIDAVTHNITLGSSGLVATNGGSATILMGTGSIWTSSGNFTTTGIGTITRETSQIVMTGDGTTLNISGDSVFSVRASANITINAGQVFGTLLVDAGKTVTCSTGTIFRSTATINGTISGSASVYFRSATTLGAAGLVNCSDVKFQFGAGPLDNSAGGTWAPTTTEVERSFTLYAGTYGGSWACINQDTAAGRTFTFGGNVTFTGPVSWDADETSRTYTIDNSGNYDVTFQDDITLAESLGTLVWTKGTGTITFSGTNDQAIITPSGWTNILEDIVINKTAGAVTGPANGLYAESFTGTNTGTGSYDPNGGIHDFTGNCSWAAAFDFAAAADTMNGSDWQIDGNFTADAQTLNATAGWDLDVTGTAVASGTGAVAYSTAGGTAITASSGPWTDNGNNTNWNFGVVATGGKNYMTLLGVG